MTVENAKSADIALLTNESGVCDRQNRNGIKCIYQTGISA